MTSVKNLANHDVDAAHNSALQDLTQENLEELELDYDIGLEIQDDVGLTEEEVKIEGQASRSLFVQMSASGPGFTCYGPLEKRYGRSEVIQVLKKVAVEWAKDYPNGPVLRIGNISYQNGGPMPPHKSHQNGIDVDFGPVSNTNQASPLEWSSAQYSRERTQDLVKRLQNNGILNIRIILFNDLRVSGVQACRGHDNHLHVSFMAIGLQAPGQYSCDTGKNLRLVRPFMQGERVKQLQQDLLATGYPIQPDGVFGDHTDRAVRAFQSSSGLEADGVVGSNTLAKLAATKAEKTAPKPTDPGSKPPKTQSQLSLLITNQRYFDYSNVAECDLRENKDFCREIQSILQAIGLLNTVDGEFGPHTQEALRQFKARYQLAGGEIFGPTTAKALLDARPGGGILPDWEGGNKEETVQAIIKEARRQGINDLNQIAYILATVEHETAGSFQPVKESYYLGEVRGENHRKTLRYKPFYGRGFVQLTWDYNYRKYSDIVGLNLIENPDLAMRPDVSLFILVDGMKRGVFTSKKLSDYFTSSCCDWVSARRIINGTVRAEEVAGLAKAWRSRLGQ